MMRHSAVLLRSHLVARNPMAGCLRNFSSSSSSSSYSRIPSHVPNIIDKYVLVWMKKYPSVKDVPSRVTPEQMEYARNWARIKISTGLCIATVLGCIYTIKLGKDAAKRGESIRKMNEDFHKAQKDK